MNRREYTRLAPLFKDVRLPAAFARTERDGGGAFVLPRKPDPVLSGGAVAEVA